MVRFKKTEEHLLALDTFVKLMRCSGTVSNDVHRQLQANITISQFGILEALYHLGPMPQKELAQKILKTPGNMTTVINNLSKAGLVERQMARHDKRYSIIHITDKGKQLIREVFPPHAEAIRQRFSVLTPEEQKILGNLLKKLGLGND